MSDLLPDASVVVMIGKGAQMRSMRVIPMQQMDILDDTPVVPKWVSEAWVVRCVSVQEAKRVAIEWPLVKREGVEILRHFRKGRWAFSAAEKARIAK